MLITAAMTVIRWYVLVFGPDGKVFFCAINYPGSWADGTLTSRFSITSKRVLAILRFVWTRDFPDLVTHMAFLSGRYPRGALVNCIVLFVITWFVWVTYIPLSDRQVNGECVDYRGASLAVKNVCHRTRISSGWCWNELFLYTISALRKLGIIRLQRYSTPSTSVSYTIAPGDII
jgi:hypothetical protein